VSFSSRVREGGQPRVFFQAEQQNVDARRPSFQTDRASAVLKVGHDERKKPLPKEKARCIAAGFFLTT
jgi:hypothetical protein